MRPGAVVLAVWLVEYLEQRLIAERYAPSVLDGPVLGLLGERQSPDLGFRQIRLAARLERLELQALGQVVVDCILVTG